MAGNFSQDRQQSPLKKIRACPVPSSTVHLENAHFGGCRCDFVLFVCVCVSDGQYRVPYSVSIQDDLIITWSGNEYPMGYITNTASNIVVVVVERERERKQNRMS